MNKKDLEMKEQAREAIIEALRDEIRRVPYCGACKTKYLIQTIAL